MSLAWESMSSLKKAGLESVPIWPPLPGTYKWLNADDTLSAIVIYYVETSGEHPEDICHEGRAYLAMRDGADVSVHEIWPMVRGREITLTEYEELRND